MIAVDANVLVYAHRQDSPFHNHASAWMTRLAEGVASWAIPWPCIHEFYAIATHPRIYDPPSTPDQARRQIDSWLKSPSVVLLSEAPQYWAILRSTLDDASVTGALVHDAKVAALCAQHGISEILTLDRDFSRFPTLITRSILP